MRSGIFLALLGFLIPVAAFILTMLTIFAGSRVGWMEDAHILTVNTSLLGQTLLKPNTTSDDEDCSKKSGLSKLACEGEQDVSDVKDSAEQKLADKINEEIGNLTQKLGIHGFYSAHILDYCEGFYTNVTAGDDKGKNVTHCSNRTTMYNFDPKKIIQAELNPDFNLTALHWPEAVDDAVHAVRVVAKAMFVLYCIGAGCLGLAILTSIPPLFSSGRLSAVATGLLEGVGWAALLIASAMATAVMNKGADAINKYGEDVGIVAYKGHRFLALTWSAMALAFVGSALALMLACWPGRRRERASSKI